MEFGWDILYQCDEHYQHCGIRAYDRQRRIRGCISGQRLVADLQEKHLGVRDCRVDIKRIFLPDRVRRAVPGLDFFMACLYPFLIGFATMYTSTTFSALYAQAYVLGIDRLAESDRQLTD